MSLGNQTIWRTISAFLTCAVFLAASSVVPADVSREYEGSKTSSLKDRALPEAEKVNVTDKMMQNAGSNNSDWLLHGRSYTNQRYSPLTQINTDNVSRLTPAALVQTAMPASFEVTPLVVNGVMYITTPVVNDKMKIMAVNAANGEQLWSTSYYPGNYKICCGPVNRGPAAGYGKIFVATLDAKLLALDAANGKILWEKQLANPEEGYSETMTPQVYNGKVIVGSSGGEWPTRGFVAAYDAKTGEQIWRWHATDPETFEGDSWKTGGGAVWTTPAIDQKRDLAIFATGNPNPDMYGKNREGRNLYTDSIVALHTDTGKLAWYYQEVKHDVWDYDAASNVLLFDVRKNGKTIPAAGQAGKTGWFYIVDRRNGELIHKSEPFVRQNENMFAKPTKEGVNILPGANGGSEWSPPAYSKKTDNVYILGMNQLMKFTTQQPDNSDKNDIRLGSAFINVKKSPVQNGTFTAINVNTGKIDWQYQAPQPMIGGALATAGNLVFTGEGNGWFRAFNAETGEKLWRFNLGAGVNAPPITYKVDGEQYVAVAAGGNFQLSYPRGSVVAIFHVPDASST